MEEDGKFPIVGLHTPCRCGMADCPQCGYLGNHLCLTAVDEVYATMAADCVEDGQ